MNVTTAHDRIAALVAAVVEEDPVRGTVFGTVGLSLTETAWAARDTDGSLAVRSAAVWPVTLAGPWRSRSDLARGLGALADLRSLAGPTEVTESVAAALGRPTVRREDQRLFRCDGLQPPSVAGTARLATDRDRALVRSWFVAFGRSAHEDDAGMIDSADRALAHGGVWLWIDLDATPMSLAARRPIVGGSARVGPVYTPPELRGHGYGSGVTAAATASIAADGAVPVLFTDLANPTSNKIYQALGYRPVEDRVVLTLG